MTADAVDRLLPTAATLTTAVAGHDREAVAASGIAPNDPRHGTTRGYHAGCRNACCRGAMARYEKAGRLARLNGGRAVLAIGAQRRLQALMRLGWSSHAIAEAANLRHRNHVWRIVNGQKGKPTTWIQRSTDAWVRDVYERLSMTIPQGRYVGRTRQYAERKGWPPPLAWDEDAIDDPTARPSGAGHTEAARATSVRAAILADLDSHHAGISAACRALDLSRDALERWCQRHEHRELYSRLVRREQPDYERYVGECGWDRNRQEVVA